MAQQTVDAGVFQAALLQIAEATSAAANAAQAAQQVAASSTAAATAAGASGGGAGTSSASSKCQIDWSNKPPVFDFPNQEQDQRHFRDWLWQLNQYLICIDEGFSEQLSQITEEPAKELNIDSAPLEVRQRSAKLSGLLSGLV